MTDDGTRLALCFIVLERASGIVDVVAAGLLLKVSARTHQPLVSALEGQAQLQCPPQLCP